MDKAAEFLDYMERMNTIDWQNTPHYCEYSWVIALARHAVELARVVNGYESVKGQNIFWEEDDTIQIKAYQETVDKLPEVENG